MLNDNVCLLEAKVVLVNSLVLNFQMMVIVIE